MDQVNNKQPDQSWSQAGSKMQLIGILSVIAGMIWGIWAYQMKTTAGWPEVNNIGLIAEQQKNILCAGFVTIGGILLFGFGSSIFQSKISETTNREEIK